ncbi:hypothetical protein DC74_6328 [Streptomyces noursei]|nr:hypothetical protein DC74_6328 [Streptomyces noursei]
MRGAARRPAAGTSTRVGAGAAVGPAAAVLRPAARSAATNPRQLSYRSSGALASARAKTASTAGASSGRSPLGGGGGSYWWAQSSAMSSSRRNGGAPVSIS